MLAVITVNSFLDNGDGANTTLREAIEEANVNPNHDTIEFDPAVFNTPKTILLTQGELAITQSVTINATIDGAGPSQVPLGITIDAGGGTDGVVGNFDGHRIFNIQDAEQIEINSLKLTGGDAPTPGESGGAINYFFFGEPPAGSGLTIKNSEITGNASFVHGGGIYVVGNLRVENSTISDNRTSIGNGGGIFFRAGYSNVLDLVSSTISGNRAIEGAGIFAEGEQATVNIIASSHVIGNETQSSSGAGGSGGGIKFDGKDLNIQLSEIRDNRAGSSGGGLFAQATNGYITIDQTTFDNNRSTSGFSAGAGAFLSCANSPVTITDTTVSKNQALGIEANVGGIAIILANNSNATIDGLKVIDNHADDDIGGLVIENSASTVNVRNSTVSGNTASHNNLYEAAGGAWLEASNGGSNTVEYSTISANRTITSADGIADNVPAGGLFIKSSAGTTTTIRNTTISGNQAQGSGGGVKIASFNGGSVSIIHSTITNNRADSDNNGVGTGGGIHVDSSSATVTIAHTIVAGNFRGSGSSHDDISGPVTASWSLVGINTGATITTAPGTTNQVGTSTPIDPRLGPLRYNGGLTPTHALLPAHGMLPDSPAINAGNSLITNPPAYDQRGNPWNRVVGMNRIDIGAFEWQANPLPGDYNFNGVVDAADYNVWRDTLGSTTDLRADGNGNGVIDVGDYDVWKGEFGMVLFDPSGNGVTDFADYLIWAATNGSTTDLRADCNEDGIVDEADFDIWFDTFGSTLEIAEFGLLSNYFDPNAPPAVVGVALGLPGVQAMDFAGKVGSGEQLRSVPLIAANTLNITFSRDVNIAYTDLQIVNLDGSSPTIFDFDYDPLSQTATWTFTASLADGRYVALLSDLVEDLDGKALDGEFYNPVSLSDAGTAVFPSGDGEAGGEFRFRFTVLAGDADHDNVDGATNYVNWQSTEPGMIIVSTTADDYDGDLTFGDVSLREAVNYANTVGAATSVQLPAGRYVLTRVGTEGSDTAYNDLDVLSTMSILGAGAGLSIIDNSGLTSAMTRRAFDVAASSASLTLSGVTIAHGAAANENGLAIRVSPGASLELVDSALLNHVALGSGAAVYVDRGSLTIRRSVITNNRNQINGGAAVHVQALSGGAASITVGETVFALNSQYQYPTGGYTTRNVQVVGNVTKTNEGRNLYDDAAGGFFDTTPGTGDYLGTPTHVVTSVADTFDHTDDNEALSIREAVDLANQAAGVREIWLPAWRFLLTRDRGTNVSDIDVAYGDLDIKKSMTIRGVAGLTSVDWKAGIVDKVFDLIGDANVAGQADFGSVSAADYTIWQDQYGSVGAFEQFSADADDDGDVDEDDYDIWVAHFGNTLQLLDVL